MKNIFLVLLSASLLTTSGAMAQSKKKQPIKQINHKKTTVKKTVPPVKQQQAKASDTLTFQKSSLPEKPVQNTTNAKPQAEKQEKTLSKKTAAYSGTGYKKAIGIKLLWGISLTGKYFLKPQHAIEAIVKIRGYKGVGSDISLAAQYEYHLGLPEVQGLNFYGGGGAFAGYFAFKENISKYNSAGYDNELYFGLSGIIGAEYKFKDLPIAISADWHPILMLKDSYGGSGFGAENGGIGIKYTF